MSQFGVFKIEFRFLNPGRVFSYLSQIIFICKNGNFCPETVSGVICLRESFYFI